MGQLLQRPSTSGGGAKVAGASVHLAANQVIASGNAALSWTGGVSGLDFDQAGFFNAVSPTIFTMPFAGVFQCSSSVFWTGLSAPGASYEAFFSINGAIIRRGLSAFSAVTTGFDNANALSALFQLNAGDTLAVIVLQNSGANQTVAGNAVTTQTFMSILGFH